MKKSYKCEKLEQTLHFLPTRIKYCCSCAEGPGVEIKDYNNIDQNEIKKTRTNIIKMLENGSFPKECRGCVEYTEIKPKSFIAKLFSKRVNKKIKHVIIDHYKQCDCNCVYCSQKVLFPDVVQNYEVLPLIKQLYKNDMLDEDLLVEFQGGNISMLKEFDELVKEFDRNNCYRYSILTNWIKYLPRVEDLARRKKCSICISLDSGTKEGFKKVKGIDAFEQVLENIYKLEKKSNANIKFKYIIVEGVNDNLEEIKSFLDITKTVKSLEGVMFEIDYRDILINKRPNYQVPSHYKGLFDFAENYCIENNLPFYITDYVKSFLQ